MPTVVLVHGPQLDVEGPPLIRLLPGVPVKLPEEDVARVEFAAKAARRRYRVFADPKPAPLPVPKAVVKTKKATKSKAAKKTAKG